MEREIVEFLKSCMINGQEAMISFTDGKNGIRFSDTIDDVSYEEEKHIVWITFAKNAEMRVLLDVDIMRDDAEGEYVLMYDNSRITLG